MDINTIIRLLVLIFALINQTLTATGKNPLPFSDETIYETISIIVTISVSIYTAWKNNNITSEAKTSQRILNALKKGLLDVSTVENLLTQVETNQAINENINEE